MSTMTTTTKTTENETTILIRVLCDEDGKLPPDVARYILERKFNEQDKARMHHLIERNQQDALSPAEKEELFAFGEVGTLLSILKAKARRTLNIKVEKPKIS